MGVEQGDYFEYGGGSGDYGGGGDVSDAFVIDYGAVDAGQTGGEYTYDPSTGEVLDTGLQQPSGGIDLFGAFFDYYIAQGYDDYTAMSMAADAASAGSIVTETSEPGAPPTLPDLPQDYFPLPYVDPYNYWQSPPYVPTFPEGPAPPPPSGPAPQKLGPCNTNNGLPGYCAQGTYHPANDPCSCVPFPAATTNASPRPPAQGGQTSPAPAPAPRPRPQAQAPTTPTCPTGYIWNAAQQRCLPTSPTSPAPACPTGQVWDPRIMRCIATPGMPGLLPAPTQPGLEDSTLADIKKIPTWLWLALAGFLILNFSGGDSKSTTVTYRRRT